MIALVEGAERQKTPNELALSILLSGLTIIFLIVCVTLWPLALYSGTTCLIDRAGRAARLPHPHHDRRPAVGHRHRRHGPAHPLQRGGDLGPRGRGGGRRRHAAARQDRHDHLRQSHGERVHPRGRGAGELDSPKPRSLASLADETPEGRSIVALAKSRYNLTETEPVDRRAPPSCPSRRRPAFPASTSAAAHSAKVRRRFGAGRDLGRRERRAG